MNKLITMTYSWYNIAEAYRNNKLKWRKKTWRLPDFDFPGWYVWLRRHQAFFADSDGHGTWVASCEQISNWLRKDSGYRRAKQHLRPQRNWRGTEHYDRGRINFFLMYLMIKRVDKALWRTRYKHKGSGWSETSSWQPSRKHSKKAPQRWQKSRKRQGWESGQKI